MSVYDRRVGVRLQAEALVLQLIEIRVDLGNVGIVDLEQKIQDVVVRLVGATTAITSRVTCRVAGEAQGRLGETGSCINTHTPKKKKRVERTKRVGGFWVSNCMAVSNVVTLFPMFVRLPWIESIGPS